VKRRAALLLIAPLSAVLAGCGGASDNAGAPATSPAATASASTPAMPTVQPCDSLKPAALAKVLGYAETVHRGTAEAPSCALTPAVKGGASFNLNYQWWYQGRLDDTLTAMAGNKGALSHISVPGADSASLITQVVKGKAAYVTGFVQNAKLVQMVNGIAEPHDVSTLTAAVTEILTQLSAGAPSA